MDMRILPVFAAFVSGAVVTSALSPGDRRPDRAATPAAGVPARSSPKVSVTREGPTEGDYRLARRALDGLPGRIPDAR